MSSNLLKWLAAVILLAAVTLALYIRSTPTVPENAPVKVAVMTWGGVAPGLLAESLGMFDGLKVEFAIIDDSKARSAAFASDDFEILLTNPDQHPREREMGLPGQMILLSDVSNGADGVIAHPSIKSVRDLAGKQVVYVQGSASDLMISKALGAHGLKRSDVVLKAVDDPSISVAALKQGDVAAAVSWEPLMSQATRDGKAHVLFTSADVPDTIVGVFVAKDSVVKTEVRLEKFIRGWNRGYEYYQSNREQAEAILADRFKVPLAELREMMKGLKLVSPKENLAWFRVDGSLSRIDIFTNDAAVFWRKEGLLRTDPPPGKRWTAAEAEEILRRVVPAN